MPFLRNNSPRMVGIVQNLITSNSASNTSAALNSETSIIRIAVTTPTYAAISGPGGTANATSNSLMLPASSVSTFAVEGLETVSFRAVEVVGIASIFELSNS
jgi:hypothetical protein